MRSCRFPFWPTLIVTLAAALALWGCASRLVKTFLETTSAGEKIIVLTTAGDPDWQTAAVGVDAFTSASSPADVSRVAEQLRTRIRSIINVAS